MKNRLQIKYYKPSEFPYTREKAIQFINDTYADNSSVNNNPKTSLPAEPIAIFYGEHIRTANVLLAIGRGGNGERYSDNLPYFLIDSAKMEEDIQNLQTLSNEHKTLIDEFKNNITSIKNSIKAIEDSIKTINSNIGFKNEVGGDSLYGYINAKLNEIWGGGGPVEHYENMQKMGSAIDRIKIGLVNLMPLKEDVSVLSQRVDTVNSELAQSILSETNTRASEDNKLMKEISELKSVSHEHNNKTLLDGYTQTNENLLDAVLKKHEHPYQAVLDGITGERVNKWDNSRTDSFNDSKQYVDEQITASRLKSSDKTLLINDTEISVNIDNHTLVQKGEDGEIKVNPNILKLERRDDKIFLLGYDDTEVSSINVSDFIKDGMLSSVELSNPIEGEVGSKYLVLTFNTSSEQESIRVDVSELVDYYNAGKGINLEDSRFSIKLSELCETDYLNVFEDGLRLSGIKNINNRLGATEDGLNDEVGKREELATRVTTLETTSHIHDNKDVIDNISHEKVISWDKSVNDISILKSDLNTEGSIKKVLFDSMVGGTPITDVRPEDVTNMQSLLRRVNVNGNPYIYASNNTEDMKHNGTTLSLVIENLALKTEIDELRREIAAINEKLDNIVNVGVNAAKEAIISEDVFKAANKALKVDIIKGVQVTYDFADDAIFKADENEVE